MLRRGKKFLFSALAPGGAHRYPAPPSSLRNRRTKALRPVYRNVEMIFDILDRPEMSVRIRSSKNFLESDLGHIPEGLGATETKEKAFQVKGLILAQNERWRRG